MRATPILIVAVFASLGFCLTGDTFTVNCAPLTQQRSDPIVYPGIPSAHTHNVVGGDAFQRTMGPSAALQANQTSCDKSIDRSNYWVPALYHQRTDKMWELVPWLNTAVYYQKRACNYAPGKKSCEANFLPLAFPDGFRMLAGDPYRRTQNSSDFRQKSVMIMCVYDGGSTEHYGFPTRQCNLMRAEVYFPSCWDGKNVDSATHTTHTAYPEIGDYNGGVCPASHPVAIMSLFYEFIFDTSSYKDINRFAFACGDPTGYGFHGDFIMGWTNRALLQTAHADCVTAQNCPKLGQQGQTPRTLLHPAIYEEEIGLHGPITKLPGNNPVVWPSQERKFV